MYDMNVEIHPHTKSRVYIKPTFFCTESDLQLVIRYTVKQQGCRWLKVQENERRFQNSAIHGINENRNKEAEAPD